MQRSMPILARAKDQFRMFMPQMPITMVGAENATGTSPATATFRVIPKMTKHEVKEYLTKIYGLPVVKVTTMNYLGKRKRVAYGRKALYFKHKDYKKAIVTFDDTLTDVGMGMRIPELDDDEDEV